MNIIDKSKFLFCFIIILELIIIKFIGLTIYKKKVLNTSINIDPLHKENLIFSSEDELTYFYEPKPNTVENEDQKSWLSEQITYTINSDSLNERYDYPVKKEKNIYRIITLGDSFTFGQYVNTSDNWPERLENLLNTKIICKNISHIEVINLGESGYDMDYSAHRYIKRGEKYSPDLLLWLLLDNDFFAVNDVMMEKINELEENATEKEKQEIKNNKDVYRFVRQANEYIIKKYGEKQLFDHHNVIMSTFLKKLTTPLVFFTFSNLPDDYKKWMSLWPSYNKSLPIFLYHNLPNIIEQKGTYEPYDFHPNTKGHELIAESIFTYLTLNKLIPCESSQSSNLQ